MRKRDRLQRALIAATLAAATAGLAASAAQASASEKLVAQLRLTSHKPGTPTGATLHLVWPSDRPGGKPKPEVKGVFHLPAGSKIDEKAVPSCTAGDAQLQAEGGAACPSGSAVGPGRVTLVTGLGAPVDPFVVDDQWYHGPGQIFGLFTPHGAPAPTVAVNRVRIRGATFIATPSLPPGYPPGTKTAPKQSDQTIHRLVSTAGSFITTPPTCPANGRWVAHSAVTYDDGSVETATSVTPCRHRRGKRR